MTNKELQQNQVKRADRILVWLTIVALIFGGLATLAVVFFADALLARPSTVPLVEVEKNLETSVVFYIIQAVKTNA